MNLYEITADMMELQEMLTENPDDQCLLDTLESVEYDLEQKADGYCKVIQNMKADAEAYANEIKRLQDRKKTIENSIERLKEMLSRSLEAIGKDKVKGNLFTVSLRNNAPQLPENVESMEIPARFMIPMPDKLDKRELLKAVKAGEVTGIELVQKKSLQIK